MLVEQEMFTDIVVGSGISGLTVATLLAKNGRNVLLLEQNPLPGGAIRQFRRGGISFDVGCHYTGCLGEGQFLQQLWRYCGVGDRIRVCCCSDNYDRLDFAGADNSLKSWFDYQRLQDELCSAFPGESRGIETYLQTVRNICDRVPYYNMDLSLSTFFTTYRRDRRSLGKFLAREISSSRLRKALGACGFLYGIPAAMTPLETHAMVSHGYYTGAWTVIGGGQAVADSLLHRFQQLGGTVRCNSEVKHLLCVDGVVSGVRLADGEEIGCQRLVYTGHPSAVADMVPQGIFRPAYTTRLRALQNTPSFFVVFARSQKKMDWRSGPLNYLRMARGVEVICADSSQPLSQRSLMMTGTSAREGCAKRDAYGITLLCPAYWDEVRCFADDRKGEGYLAYKKRVTAALVAEAEKNWSSVVGAITPLASGSPLTFRDFLSAPEGCSYGVMHSLDQYTPDIRTRLRGFYLAGQSILMTGLVGASVAAVASAGEIIGLEELWNKIRKV